MKFSFEGEKYRKDLADKLREERSEDPSRAKETLQQEKGTLKYQISRGQKQVNREELREQRERELMKSYETIDIEDRIPEDIKLAIDKARIDIASGGKKFHQLFTENPELRKRINELCDELSNGQYRDNKHANHVIMGYEKRDPGHILDKEYSGSSEFLDNEIWYESNLWFAIGESYWYQQPWQQLLIFSPENENYRELLENLLVDMAIKLKWITRDDMAQLGKEAIKKVLEQLKPEVEKLLENGRLSYRKLGNKPEDARFGGRFVKSAIIYYCLLNEIPVDDSPTEGGLTFPQTELRYLNKKGPLTWASLSNVAIDLARGKMYKHRRKVEKQESEA